MGFEKGEKKLGAEIVSFIDLEAAKLGVSRQEIISRLAQVVISDRNATEVELVRNELKIIRQHLALKEDEVSYLRGELISLHRGISKLAENLASGNQDISSFESRLLPLEDKMTDISRSVAEIKQQVEYGVRDKKTLPSRERQILWIIIGILTALFGLFLILTRI